MKIANLQKHYISFLKKNGYNASLRNNYDIDFKFNNFEQPMYLEFDTDGINNIIFTLTSGIDLNIKNDNEMEDAALLVNELNKSQRIAKIWIEKEDGWANAVIANTINDENDLESTIFVKCELIKQLLIKLKSEFNSRCKRKNNIEDMDIKQINEYYKSTLEELGYEVWMPLQINEHYDIVVKVKESDFFIRKIESINKKHFCIYYIMGSKGIDVSILEEAISYTNPDTVFVKIFSIIENNQVYFVIDAIINNLYDFKQNISIWINQIIKAQYIFIEYLKRNTNRSRT
jgi:hypothetical protein